jgi:hypothetical protein
MRFIVLNKFLYKSGLKMKKGNLAATAAKKAQDTQAEKRAAILKAEQ